MSLRRIFLLIVLLAAMPLGAAYKVRHHTYDWRVLRTPHFDIHYDAGQEEMAGHAGRIMENAHTRYADILRFELTHVIPVFLYNGHNDFEDTDITYEILPEGVGGFTEVFKNRVVVPFPGSYADFRHVLSHELVHAFQYNVFYGDFWESLFLRPFFFTAPLWFMEGMAEYLSQGGIDAGTDAILRDAVLSGMMPTLRELDDLARLPSYKYYFVYKGGQSFFAWVAERFGERTIGELLKTYRSLRDMGKTFEVVLGRKMEDLDREWSLDLKKKYWPDIRFQDVWEKKYSFVTRHFQDDSFQNAKPVWHADGRRILFFTDSSGLPELVSADIAGLEPKKTIIRAGLNVSFEELHASDNKLSVSRDGRHLCFVSKQGRSDRINIYSFRHKRVVRRLDPRMDKVFSAAFSPDGEEVVFSANKNGRNDLYVMAVSGNAAVTPRRLTEDTAVDLLPFWGVDGWVYFASGRGEEFYSRRTAIWRIRPDNPDGVERVTPDGVDSSSPVLSPDGRRLAFVSRSSGTANINIMEMSNRSVRILTDTTGGAFDPAWSPDGSQLAFVLYNRLGQDIVTVAADDTPGRTNLLQTDFSRDGQKNRTVFRTDEAEGIPVPSARGGMEGERGVSSRMTPDWVNFALAFSDYYGLAFSGQVILSDITGSHQFGADLSLLTKTKDFNFDAQYLYQRYRLNLELGAFNIKNYYLALKDDAVNTEIFYKRQAGGSARLLYPLNRFVRVAGGISFVRNWQVFEETLTNNMNVDFLTPSLALTFDNSVWNGAFYTRGSRGALVYEYGIPAAGSFWNFHRVYLDARQYAALTRRSSLAFQAVAGSIWGRDAGLRRFAIGGLNSVRGYQYEVFRGEKMALLKTEFRFPFVDVIRLGWPLPFTIQNIAGVFFWDFGAVWDDTARTRFAAIRNETLYLDVLKSGLGFGVRLNIFHVKLIFDCATWFDGHAILPLQKWRGYLTLGYDF